MSIFGCQNTYTTVWIMKIRSKLTKQKQKQKTKQTKTKHQQQQKTNQKCNPELHG